MPKYSPEHYSTGIDPVVTQGKGKSIVLTTRGPNNEYIEARVTEKYNKLGAKTIDAIDSLRTNIKDPDNLDAAIQSLENAISIAPGYNWMAGPPTSPLD